MTIQPVYSLFKDTQTIRRLFGPVLPHEREDVEYPDPVGHPNVKFVVSKGELPEMFVNKAQKFGAAYPGKVRQTAKEMMLNRIGKFFFSTLRIGNKSKDEFCKPCIFPDQLAYSGVLPPSAEEGIAQLAEETIFVNSRHIPSFIHEELFYNWPPRIRAFTAPLLFGFGLGDNRFDNFPFSTEHTYPLKAGYYNPSPEMEGINAPAIVFVDTGMIYDKSPLNPTYQSARKDIEAGYMPCINRSGDNDLKAFMDEFQPWIGRLDDKEFLELYYLICQITETDRDEANRYLNEIVKPDFSNSRRNLDIFCAAGNEELPLTVLEQSKWDTEAPVKYNLEDLILASKGLAIEGSGLRNELKLKIDGNNTKFFLDLNNGHLIFVESLNNGRRVKVTDVFSKETQLLSVNSPHQVAIGNRVSFGQGKLIAEVHLMLSVVKQDNDLYILIENLQRCRAEDMLSTQIWKSF